MGSLIDRRPPGWLVALFRAPVGMFHRRLGWLFGGRLLLLRHEGRHTGLERATVLEVVARQGDPPTWYVAAAWGDRSDWYRNLNQHPRAQIMVGRGRYRVVARVAETDEAVRVHSGYVREHPWAARVIGRVLGIDLLRSDPKALAHRIPLVALTAEDTEKSQGNTVARVVTTRTETQATYDRIAPFYEVVEGFWERRARSAGLDALSPGRGESVFEIGCGPGYTLAGLARTLGPHGRVVGVDLAFNMCRRSDERLTRRTAPGTGAVVQGDAVQLPFVGGAFDAGVVSFTLELFDTPEIPAVLAECRRVLRPGGRLAVVALSKEKPAPVIQRAYEWGHARFPRLLDCRPIHVERSLSEAGFTIAAMRELSLWGLPVAVGVGRKGAETSLL